MAKRFKRTVDLNREGFAKLYAVSRYLGRDLREKTQLSIPFDVYFQDPAVAQQNSQFGFDASCFVDWEPHLGDGPTSARFAIVDWNADTGTLTPPARWDGEQLKFFHGDLELDRSHAELLQFHQVNVWAILQRALRFFEESSGLGRRIPWGFDGNRLIVVPHAGYGQNAYYDRKSQSLQFYYFDKEDGSGQVFTCLSTDIIHHEFGHAVLDGVRPLFSESASVETAAFHEFMGDLSALLLLMRNNDFRGKLVQETRGNLEEGQRLAGIAEQFGNEVKGQPYLRSALNPLTMAEAAKSDSPHLMSQVLTGAMFDILIELSRHYQEERKLTAKQAFAYVIQRIQRTAVQPLDFLPPVDATFSDYALAVLRVEEIADPRDPYGYREVMRKVFVKRGIIAESEASALQNRLYLYDSIDLDYYHSFEAIGASKANAYRFLDDNRKKLGLPENRDVLVANLYHADKDARQGRRLARQLILEYVWREDLKLEGEQYNFGRYEGRWASMLCGGTLVFDDTGTLLWWSRKEDTPERRQTFLANVARRVKKGQIGELIESERGLLGHRIAPFTEKTVDGSLRIELTPHLGVFENQDEEGGERRWEISS